METPLNDGLEIQFLSYMKVGCIFWLKFMSSSLLSIMRLIFSSLTVF